ncbi:FAD-dependent oxidoreductase [Paraburkholderia oxyphila]|uniref:FAD-dependent oxidoreductase n=1 Tax=Paraburkholderia oxyphila TaxID=614212 RepID=UPI000480F9C9|nr:FAD-dependent oxidoreductase [Paraburkholderia oxyphila]
MNDDALSCDLVVIGAGMAGMTAAARAADRGARVVVIEKAPRIGGSALMSGGILWTSSSDERMQLYGGGSRLLGNVVRRAYPEAISWLKRQGIKMSGARKVLSGFGYQIDIVEYLEECRRTVERTEGYVVCGTSVQSLLKGRSGEIVGVRTVHSDGAVDVHAPYTLLATGGYQGSAELRARYIHENARNMLVRANPHSSGDAIELALAVGAQTSEANRGFYGHLVSRSPSWGDERFFSLLAQYHSEHGLLFNENGYRFCDESTGDHNNAWWTVFQPNARALLLWDRRVQDRYATASSIPGQPGHDKFNVAMDHGGEGRICRDHADLLAFANSVGFDGERLIESLADFNIRAETAWETLVPPRTEACRPLNQPDFYALVVYPSITYTFGGLTIDANTRVLGPEAVPITGLLAAGADAGDVYGQGYAGGLAQAMSLGIVAAATAGW